MSLGKWQNQSIMNEIKVLCEQTREANKRINFSFGLRLYYLVLGILWLIFMFRVRGN